jgi:hypothetical protein
LCEGFIDWQRVFERMNWTKIIQIQKENGIDWYGRKLINKLYVDQRVKVRLDQDETRSVKTERRVRQG